MLRAAEVESFSAFEFLDHARARARAIALIAAGAGVVALAVSLLIPKQYTATASVLIDPPSTVIASPVYFESLRAYESLAASDSLFARAVEKFHLRDDGSPAGIQARKFKLTHCPSRPRLSRRRCSRL